MHFKALQKQDHLLGKEGSQETKKFLLKSSPSQYMEYGGGVSHSPLQNEIKSCL